MPIHDDTLKDADDNRPVVEKTTIVERSDFLYNFEDLPEGSRGKYYQSLRSSLSLAFRLQGK